MNGAYELTTGTIADVRAPLAAGDEWIVVTGAERFAPGDEVEVRNEYQMARACLPAVHRCRVTAVAAGALRVEPAPTLRSLAAQIGVHVVKRTTVRLAEFSLDGHEPWELRAADPHVAVEIGAAMAADGTSVTLRATRRFARELTVLSETLRFTGLPPLLEVYRKNGALDRGPAFQRAYHVDRHGAQFGTGDVAMYVYGPREVSSLAVESRGAVFEIASHTGAKAAPHHPAAAVDGELWTYASFPAPVGGPVALTLEFADVIEFRGLVVHWYRPDELAVSVRAFAEGGRELLSAECGQGGGPVDRLLAHTPARARRVNVEFSPPPGARWILLRQLDVLVGREGFDLIAFLDDHRDHRFCRFVDPSLRTREMGRMTMESRSASQRSAGEEASSALALRLGPAPVVRPRLSHVPGGARAALIWTEHADRTTVDTQRAALFGASTIVNPADAAGGFVGHDIPTTKSVFVDNPEGVPTLPDSCEPQAALRSSPEFAELCRGLVGRGHEICVHAPRPINAPPAEGLAAAELAEREFGSSTWIDHSSSAVHCGMSGQGLNPESPYYMGDIWRATGHRWFWQFGCEDANEQRAGSINVQQLRIGDRFHTPLWWRHPTQTESFVSWATIRGGDLEVYTDEAIAELIEDRGVCITHTYPAAIYADPLRSQYLVGDGERGWRTSERFESVLGRFAARIAAGELVAMTVRDAMTYWEAVDALQVRALDDGSTAIVNPADDPVVGLCVLVDDQPPIVFTLPAGETALLRIRDGAVRVEIS